jgi:uncharacterized protein (TIGR02594 family)
MILSALLRAASSFWAMLNKLPPEPAKKPAPAESQATKPKPPASTNEKPPVADSPPPAKPPIPVVPQTITPLSGPFRYLIAVDGELEGKDGEIFETGYNGKKPKKGRFFHYGNLYDQTGTGAYGPYPDRTTDTASNYKERLVAPMGAGWVKLLADQCHAALAAGAEGIEWDNPDGYTAAAVMDAVNYAAGRGLTVLAKNPLACTDWSPNEIVAYVKHPAVVGVVVERGAGSPSDMDALRINAGKPDLFVRFVAFKNAKEDGRAWAANTARLCAPFKNMAVTISLDGEYTSSADVQGPWPAQQPAPEVQSASASGKPNYRSLVPGGFFSSPSDKSLPVSIRMNNPGAVNGAGWERTYPGYVETIETTPGNRTTIFETPENGVAVWWELMRKYHDAGATTVGAIINKYGGGQDYSAYVKMVSQWSGYSASKTISLDDDAGLLPFAKAMFHYEAGRPTPLKDDQILYGFALARSIAKGAAAPAPGIAPTPSQPTMLILRGIAGTFAGTAYPHGALDEPSALEYAKRHGYVGKVLDVSGETGPTSAQTLTALREFRRDASACALYGFSGGAYNLKHIIAALTTTEKQRIKLLVVLGAPNNPASTYQGPWELVYRADPPTGHMDGPRALLAEVATAEVRQSNSPPPWIAWAEKEVGFHERGDNLGIERYTSAAHTGSEGDPWCAIFVNAGLETCGIRGTRSAMARSFEHDPNFVKLSGPAFGAITTMWRGSPSAGTGHVFFYIGESDNGILALGGNQSDQVCKQYEPRNRIVGYFWPKSEPHPKTGPILVTDKEGHRKGGSET